MRVPFSSSTQSAAAILHAFFLRRLFKSLAWKYTCLVPPLSSCVAVNLQLQTLVLVLVLYSSVLKQ